MKFCLHTEMLGENEKLGKLGDGTFFVPSSKDGEALL